jgi:hypothetical protein
MPAPSTALARMADLCTLGLQGQPRSYRAGVGGCAAMSAGSGTASRPDVVRCAGTAHTPPALDRSLPRQASDTPGLTPQDGRQQVRHEQ